jgi:hypothetical protein
MNVKINGFLMKPYRITSEYWEVDGVHCVPHKGIDLAMKEGTDILSPVHGVISKIVDYGSENIGKGVFIKTEDGQQVILGHLSEIDVRKGQIVEIGQKIAESGNTGRSTGEHLHIGLKDAEGHFQNPKMIEEKLQELAQQMDKLDNYKLGDYLTGKPVIDSVKSVMEPFNKTYDWISHISSEIKLKGFSIWFGEQLLYLCKVTGMALIELNDLFFLMPALVFLITYFFIGKNRTTRFIVPAFTIYGALQILKYQIR